MRRIRNKKNGANMSQANEKEEVSGGIARSYGTNAHDRCRGRRVVVLGEGRGKKAIVTFAAPAGKRRGDGRRPTSGKSEFQKVLGSMKLSYPIRGAGKGRRSQSLREKDTSAGQQYLLLARQILTAEEGRRRGNTKKPTLSRAKRL